MIWEITLPNFFRPTGFYAWLSKQKKPSPFIEFPYSRNFLNFIQVANGVMADQPTGVAIGRCWPQMSYFLMDIGNESFSAKKLRLLESSPYRFWVQKNYNDNYRKKVEAESSLKYATNVVICGGMVVTRDISGKNEVSHFASHDAAPIELKDVYIYGENIDHFSIGKIKR